MGSQAKILVVDDSKFMRNIIKETLVQIGYGQILTASTGTDALEICKLNMPDLILLDVNMVDMDGITLLKQIIEFNPDAKCVMVSAIDQVKVIELAKKIGAVDYLKKPFDADELVQVVHKVLGDDADG
ncbi:response regulator [Candidatus Woesearchaeota archaeon]|nr:response regulator [Candidatus Woesearchaeota archaeon]